MLSRIIYGARTSLIVGICAPFLGFLIGGAIGMSAGYFRGKIDLLAVGFIDVLLAFPALVLALTFVAYLGQSLFNVTLALGHPVDPGGGAGVARQYAGLGQPRLRAGRPHHRRQQLAHPDARDPAQPAAAACSPSGWWRSA